MFEELTGTTDTETREGIAIATDGRESRNGRIPLAKRYVETDTHAT